jgi:hypothetical protein
MHGRRKVKGKKGKTEKPRCILPGNMQVAFVCNPSRFAARLPLELRAAVVMPPFRRHIRHRPAKQVPYLFQPRHIPTSPHIPGTTRTL